MRVLSILFFVLAFVHSSYAKNQEFPGRDLYLDVKHIEMADLAKEYSNSIIVDVRSKYEFDTLHIKSASHVSLRSPEFISSMQQLRKQYPHKKIVTYCNGKTCMKSYKAARKCQQHGVRNVYAFDAGIMDWAKNQPNRSVLLGQSPLNENKLISKDDFNKRLLTVDDFIEKARHDKAALIIDARDPLQREGISLFPGAESRASLQDTRNMDNFIAQAAKQNKTMYIYDEAGKQVRWLMYRLEEKGVKKYYFMKHGMKAYFAKLRDEMAK